MQTHLEFRSARFRDPEGGGNSYNPEIYGRTLAGFLSEQFSRQGFAGTVIEEDWGWMIELARDPFPLWLGCGSYSDTDPDSWLVFIEPSKPSVRRWFRRFDTREAVADIASRLEQVLTTQGDATALKWWSDLDSGRK